MTSNVEITGRHQEAAWRRRELPGIEQVRPGLWSLPIPLPMGTMRYVNVYVFESSDGLTLVDAGWDDLTSWQVLQERLASIGRSVADVRRVLVTHVHRDHYGQAGRVREASGALIAMHPREAAALPARWGNVDQRHAAMLAWLHRAGVPDAQAPTMLPMSVTTDPPDFAEPDVMLEDGDRIDAPNWQLRAVWTPGHTPGHLCFTEGTHGLLLSGDGILPRITPNVSITPWSEANPLGRYLDTLARVGDLETTEVLPAHEYRFRGLSARSAELRDHHAKRLQNTLDQVADRRPCTTFQVTSASTWSRPWAQTPPPLRRFAIGETLAHLTLLRVRGQLVLQDAHDTDLWSLPS